MLNKIKTSQLQKIFILLLVVVAVLTLRDFIPGVGGGTNDASGVAKAINKYCTENEAVSKGKENCYSEEFKKLAEREGPEFSFAALDELQKIDQDARGCHLIAHGIGWGSYKRDPFNWRTLVQNLPTICNYGSIHGVLESYVLNLPGKSLSPEVIPTICGENPRADCNHIIGHLLLVQTDADVGKALDLCEVFKDTTQNSFCISGVFMEYQTALNLVSHDLVPESWLNWPVRLQELEDLCRSHRGKYAEGCWEEIVHVALVKFNNDPQTIFDFCASAQVPEGAKRCKRHSLGIIGASKNFNLSLLAPVCQVPQKNDPSFESECYPAMVSSALSTIPTLVPEAVSFCKGIREEFQPSCFSMIGVMGFSNPAIRESLPENCRKAPKDLQNYCLGVSSALGNNSLLRPKD